MNSSSAAVDELDAAVAALRRGMLVCYPTETTYGLAADITQGAALARLVALKGRDPQAPFGLIVADVAQAASLASVWPARAVALAAAHWPGPLTLVVPARRDLPPEIVGESGGVGLRVSSHPTAAALVGRLGRPITATSTNPSGARPALSVAEARGYFGDRIAVYLDAGAAPRLSASTVVQIDGDGRVKVLRSGAVAIDGTG